MNIALWELYYFENQFTNVTYMELNELGRYMFIYVDYY